MSVVVAVMCHSLQRSRWDARSVWRNEKLVFSAESTFLVRLVTVTPRHPRGV